MKIMLAAVAVICISVACGCKATKPSTVTDTVAGEVKRHITVGGKDWKNPIPYSPDAVKEGAEHFQHHCQICHGLDGQNTGVPFAPKMDPPVANLASKEIQEYADGQLKWIMENGIAPSGMPGWRGIVEDDEMWKMVHYIRHLPAKGSLGAPPIFKEEAEEHAQMEHGKGQSAEHKHKH